MTTSDKITVAIVEPTGTYSYGDSGWTLGAGVLIKGENYNQADYDALRVVVNDLRSNFVAMANQAITDFGKGKGTGKRLQRPTRLVIEVSYRD